MPPFNGLRVRCPHDLIWPQPGDTVTIIAEALHSSIDVLGTTPVEAEIEIWYDVETADGRVREASAVETLEHQLTYSPDSGTGIFTNACRAGRAAAVSTLWRGRP